MPDLTDPTNVVNDQVPVDDPTTNPTIPEVGDDAKPEDDDGLPEKPETDEGGEGEGEGDATAEEFDRGAIEQQYGLPEGALADYETEADALSAIRESMDQWFTQRLLQPEQGQQQVETPEVPGTQQTDQQKTAQKVAAGSLEDLQKKVENLESLLTKQQKAQQEQTTREVTEKATSVIDGWNSPKYGTSKSRTFKQAKELREMLGYVREHTESRRNAGQPVPPVDKVLTLIRLWHDENFDPKAQKVAPAQKQQPLGTPGGHNNPSSGKDHSNIHNAVMASFRGR